MDAPRKYLRAFCTTLIMLQDRGYTCYTDGAEPRSAYSTTQLRRAFGIPECVRDVPPEHAAPHMNEHTLASIYENNACAIHAERTHDMYSVPASAQRVWVFFPHEPKVGVKAARAYKASMLEHGITHALLICKQGLSSFTKKEFEADKSVHFEVFELDFLQVPKVYHNHVGQHTVLTDAQVARLKSRYNMLPSQVPRLLMHDAVTRYYGLQPGQFVRFLECVSTLEPGYTYRIVWAE